jgi:signal transduction histidine kinase
MFRSAVIKLTALYLAVIMLISFFFSMNVYRISTQEIDRSIAREQNLFQGGGRMMIPFSDTELQQQHDQQLAIGRNNLIWQLIYTNIAIFFLAGGVSYVFARMTIEPIEESHEKQKRFTADASHELRTPLAAMKAEIEVALRDKESGKKELNEVLSSNLEEVEKMQQLVSALLALAREDSDIKLEKDRILIAKIVDEVSAKYRKLKGAKIENQVPKELTVTADQTYFIELISILVDNAVKYSDGKIEVMVTALTHNKQIEIQVIDHGVGIAEDEIPHIFDRFYRIDSSRTKNRVEGYGLGLSLAKRIVELHHGEISVKSKLDEGSTFVVKLPA